MKVCPVCSARAFDDADTCYGCLHRFENPAVKEDGLNAGHDGACGESCHAREAVSLPLSGRHATKLKGDACPPKMDRAQKGCGDEGVPLANTDLSRNDAPVRARPEGGATECLHGCTESGPVAGREWTVGIELPTGVRGVSGSVSEGRCKEGDLGPDIVKAQAACSRSPSILICVHLPDYHPACADSPAASNAKPVPVERRSSAMASSSRTAGTTGVRP